MAVEVGQQAPDFELTNQFGETVKLSDYAGKKNVVLVFYPFAFSVPCTAELCAIRDQRESIEGEDTQVLGVSCDSKFTLKAFAESQGLEYPLLADFWPHGEVAKAYGVFDEGRGLALRGTFIIDKSGTVRWSIVNPTTDVRSTDEYREALAQLAA
jgi:mycoredoxin-dependent peroxiredoxin